MFPDEEHLKAFLDLSAAAPEDVLLSSWQERAFEPAFVVFWAHYLGWLVVAVRGTSGWESLLTDVAADNEEVVGGLCHSGALRAAKWVLKKVRTTVIAGLRQYPDYKLVCVGHSMGGDIAAILALLFRKGEGDIPVLMLDEFLVAETVADEGKEKTQESSSEISLQNAAADRSDQAQKETDEAAQKHGYSQDGNAATVAPPIIDPLGLHLNRGIAISSAAGKSGIGGRSSKTANQPAQTQKHSKMDSKASPLIKSERPPASTAPHEPEGHGQNAMHPTQSDAPALGRRAFACVFGATPVMSPELSAFCVPFVFATGRNGDFATRLSVLSMDMIV